MKTDISIKKGTWLGYYKALTIENSIIRVTILPELDARVIKYRLKSSGHNQLFDNLKYPGAIGMSTGMKPFVLMGNFESCLHMLSFPFAIKYSKDYKVIREDNRIKVVLLGSGSGLKIEVTYSIYENSTRLGIEMRLLNESTNKANVQVEIHLLLAVGGKCDESLIISIPDKEEILKYRFKGSVFQHTIYMPPERWAAVCNSRTREALQSISRKPLTGQYIWAGNDGITLEPLSEIKELGYGDSLEFNVDYFITEGMGALDRIQGNLLSGFSTDRVLYKRPQTINLTPGFGAIEPLKEGMGLKARFAFRGKAQKTSSKKLSFFLDSSACV